MTKFQRRRFWALIIVVAFVCLAAGAEALLDAIIIGAITALFGKPDA